MANEQERPAKPKGSGMKITSIVLFWVGVVAILICVLSLVTYSGNMLEPESIPTWNVLIYGSPTGFLFMLIGAILYFVGRRQGKKQRSLPEAHDSNADYNKTVKKS